MQERAGDDPVPLDRYQEQVAFVRFLRRQASMNLLP
jgi:hypothetical protein